MSQVLLLTSALQPSAEVLPALALLPHQVRVLPREGSALLDAPAADVIFVDGRQELAQARDLCRLIRTTGVDVPVLLVVSPDGRSVRAFDRRARGQVLSFVRAGRDIKSSTLLDLETMSEWDFTGRATAGELSGAQLARIEILLDYWFDWKTYHPDTEVLKPWRPAVKKVKPTAIPKPNDDAKVPADPPKARRSKQGA